MCVCVRLVGTVSMQDVCMYTNMAMERECERRWRGKMGKIESGERKDKE